MKKSKVKKPSSLFIMMALAGIGFGVGGMLTPPEGIIDGSVLIMAGQCFLLAAGVLGFTVDIDIKEGEFAIKHTESKEKDK